MKESQVPGDKLQTASYKAQAASDRLPAKIEALFESPSEEMNEYAQARLTKALIVAKNDVILYGQLHHPIISSLYLAMRKDKVVAIDFGIDEETFIHRTERQFNFSIYYAPDETAAAILQVQEYLEGQRTRFDLPTDLSVLTDFQRQVLNATQQIPRGRIATYMDIALKIGKPKAVRAVGQALGRNPIPIVIPCHRVIASDGSLGGYSGGGGLSSRPRGNY